MNIEIYQFWVNMKEEGGDRVTSIWKKALTAVFNSLEKREFLNAAAVYEDVNLLAVVSVNARLTDYEGKVPF